MVNKQPVPSPLIGFLGRELIEAAVDKGVAVRPPQPDTEYCAFADPSGGVGDAFTAAVAHRNADGSCVLDCLHEVTASAAAPTGSCDHISPCPNVQKALLAEALGDRCGGAHVDEPQNALLAQRVVIAPGDEGEEHARAKQIVDTQQQIVAEAQRDREGDVGAGDADRQIGGDEVRAG